MQALSLPYRLSFIATSNRSNIYSKAWFSFCSASLALYCSATMRRNPTSNISRLADKLQAEIHLRLHIFLHRIMLEQIIGEDHERLEREYI